MREPDTHAHATPRRWIGGAAFGLLAAAIVAALLSNAWIVDDTYITLRVVENFVDGRGLTWNPGDRVQVFTHPLWLLVVSAAFAVTRDPVRSTVGLSLVLCLVTFVLGCRSLARDGAWRRALWLLLLLSSKAFMDWTSSGLENPLAYLLVVAFLIQLGEGVDTAPRRLAALWLTASLAFVNRPDSGLLYLPALVWISGRAARGAGPRTALAVLAGTLPATAWLAFATLYYGFPLPNTYYAKVSTGVPLADRLERGIAYFGNSLAWDSASHLLVLACLVLALRRRQRAALLALAGVGLYYLFILGNAAATHMSGRFFAVPFCLALFLLARLWPSPRSAAALAALLVAYNLWNPIAPWKMNTRWYEPRADERNRIDTSYQVHETERHVLLRTPDDLPHLWYRGGLAFRRHPARVNVGGAGGAEAIGYFAYAAGPEKIVVDYCGLGDPLLARLPACNVSSPDFWKSGHFYRLPPDGYLESLASGENRIQNPAVRAYYDALLRVVRGPDLFDPTRLATIVRFNLGLYDSLLEGYAAQVDAALGDRDCRRIMAQRVGPFELR